MSSTFFMLPLANRINEPLVKFEVLAATGEDGGSGEARRGFLGDGSEAAKMLLLLIMAAPSVGVGGGSIRCCCWDGLLLLSRPLGTLNCSGGDEDGLLPTTLPPFLFGGLGYLRSWGGCIG